MGSNDALRVSSAEKNLLLVDEEKYPIAFGSLLLALFLFLLILIILLPKIYISNRVYLISRDISRLYSENDLLIEERHRLQRTLEDIKIKYLLKDLGK